MEPIEVQARINAPIDKVWDYWTAPKHIMNWNFASSDWHCPKAENNVFIGGEFHYYMEAKDGSFGFDYWGTYVAIEEAKFLEFVLGDDRRVTVLFESNTNETIVTETFDPETTHPVELQKNGWQMILDNFKAYVEE